MIVAGLLVKYLGALAFFSQQMGIHSFKAGRYVRYTLIFLTVNPSGAHLSKRRVTKKRLLPSLLLTVLLSPNKKPSGHTVGLESEIMCFTAPKLPNYC